MVVHRRRSARSDNSAYASNPNELPTIEEWFASKDLYRVVAHGLPRLQPFQTKASNTDLDQLYKDTIKPALPELLQQFGVSLRIARLDYWYKPHKEEDGEDTLVIFTTNKTTSLWTHAARAILSLFEQHGSSSLARGMQVEIRNEALMYSDCSDVLPDDPLLLTTLTRVREIVLHTVERSLLGMWSSIAYHSRYARFVETDPPKRPTILIFVRPGKSADFGKVEDDLAKLLEAEPVDVHLELLPGEISLLAVPKDHSLPKRLRSIPEKPLNGASISAEGAEDVGSLGFWAVLNLPKQRREINCAITCYHVVESSDVDIATHTHVHGVQVDDPRGQLTVQYPAMIDARKTMNMLQNCVHPGDVQDQQVLAGLMSKPAIGRVILASGLRRTKEKRRLDWALIETPSTYTANRPPLYSAIRQYLPDDVTYIPNNDSKVKSFGSIAKEDWVTKPGGSSAYTVGRINKLSRDVEWGDGTTSRELEVLSDVHDFAEPGDSGSMVVNAAGEIVGLLFARDSCVGRMHVGLFTPIDVIQQDIKEMTDDGFLSLD